MIFSYTYRTNLLTGAAALLFAGGLGCTIEAGDGSPDDNLIEPEPTPDAEPGMDSGAMDDAMTPAVDAASPDASKPLGNPDASEPTISDSGTGDLEDSGMDPEDAGSSGLSCTEDDSGELLLELSGGLVVSTELGNEYGCFGLAVASQSANFLLSVPIAQEPGLVDISVTVEGLAPGETAEGIAASVTVNTGEGGGLWSGETCSMDVYLNELTSGVSADGGAGGSYRIAGAVYCDDALVSLGEDEPLLVASLDFVSLVAFD